MWREFLTVVRREYLKWVRVPVWVSAYFVLPFVYLVLFGQAFNLNNLFPAGGGAAELRTALLGAPDYFSYFTAGIIGFVILTTSLYAGTGVLFDKQLGIQSRMSSTPAPRSALFAGSLVFRSMMAMLPCFLAIAFGLAFAHVPGLVGLTVNGSVSALGVGEIVLAAALLSLMFTALFLAFGYAVDTNESYFGVTSLLNLPLLFTSNAMFPQSTMPGWLRSISAYNPISLAVNVVRENLFASVGYPFGPGTYLLGLALWAALLIGVALLVAARELRAK